MLKQELTKITLVLEQDLLSVYPKENGKELKQWKANENHTAVEYTVFKEKYQEARKLFNIYREELVIDDLKPKIESVQKTYDKTSGEEYYKLEYSRPLDEKLLTKILSVFLANRLISYPEMRGFVKQFVITALPSSELLTEQGMFQQPSSSIRPSAHPNPENTQGSGFSG